MIVKNVNLRFNLDLPGAANSYLDEYTTVLDREPIKRA
jgi:hypothetical protein